MFNPAYSTGSESGINGSKPSSNGTSFRYLGKPSSSWWNQHRLQHCEGNKPYRFFMAGCWKNYCKKKNGETVWSMHGSCEKILAREVKDLVIYSCSLGAGVAKHNIRYKTRLKMSICISFRALASKAESVMHHFSTIDKSNVSPFDGSLAETNSIFCYECKMELFLNVHSCKECRHVTTTFCIDYAKNVTKTFTMERKNLPQVRSVASLIRNEVVEKDVQLQI